ncbi:MAG: GreA/GreB family elongation factor [Candidatus Eisenbacteria bacterium]
MTTRSHAADPPKLTPALAAEVEKTLAALDSGKLPAPDALETLADRLFQAEAWAPLHELCDKTLDRAHSDAESGDDDAVDRVPAKLPRFLVRASEALGDPAQLFDALATAHGALAKDATLAMRYADALEERGEREEALAVTSNALDTLLKSTDHSALDPILMKLLEAGEADRLAVAMPALGALARRGEFKRIQPFLDLAGETLTDEAAREIAWRELTRLARELGPSAESLRGTLVRIAAARLGKQAAPLIEAAGLDAGAPLAEAVAKFDDLALRAPGTYHEHGSWGVGIVTALEANAVTVDFPKRPGQKMTLAAAKSALAPLPAEDPRVLAAWNPAELERLRKEDPVRLVVSVLKALKREATATEIKKLLLAWGTVPSSGWTSFWNTAKKRLADDPRIDASHAFEQRYAIGREGQAVRLPGFPRHEPPRKAFALLRRLLGQHPGAKAELFLTWSEGLLRWADDERLIDSERVAALAWSAELAPQPDSIDGRGVVLLAEAFTRDFDFSSLASTLEQRRALDWALRGPSWEEAARSALSSRLNDLREAAFAAIDERHGADAPTFWQALWVDAPNWPNATVASLEHADPAKKPVASLAAVDPWYGVRGLVNLLETTPEEPLATRVTNLLADDSWLVAACRANRAAEDLETLITRRCLTWKTTDRFLEPVVEFARATGMNSLVQRVAEARQSRVRVRGSAADEAAQAYTGKNYLSRRTYERTKSELDALEAALKSTIPQAIQKARELGDLKENAEYHSAKLKQSQAEARVGLLAERLREVTLIDDLAPEPGIAGPGTEVLVELDGGGTQKVWILGEGDGDFGSEVVSYRAAVGKALLGHKEKERVLWSADGRDVGGTIRSVRARPPA